MKWYIFVSTIRSTDPNSDFIKRKLRWKLFNDPLVWQRNVRFAITLSKTIFLFEFSFMTFAILIVRTNTYTSNRKLNCQSAWFISGDFAFSLQFWTWKSVTFFGISAKKVLQCTYLFSFAQIVLLFFSNLLILLWWFFYTQFNKLSPSFCYIKYQWINVHLN